MAGVVGASAPHSGGRLSPSQPFPGEVPSRAGSNAALPLPAGASLVASPGTTALAVSGRGVVL